MAKQLALALRAPADHGELVHSGVRHGAVLVWQKPCRRQWIKVNPSDDLARAMSEHRGEEDRFFTPNEFHQWRRVDLLRSLRACYVDLDNWTDWPAVLDALSMQNLPSPSLVVESGRGLHLYWTLDPTSKQALPVWQAIQDNLVQKLLPFGADAQARDCTRVLRIVGSKNSKNDTEVRGWVINPRKWSLHELADEVLGPRKRTTVASLESARVKRQASVHQRTGTYRLWHTRYQDLCLIADHHAFMKPSGIQVGQRDTMLFLLANALSWFTAADTLQDAIMRVAKTYTPSLSHREVSTYTRPIVNRALAAQRGETVEWQGKPKDPRYAFMTPTLRTWLGPLITPALEPRLVALGPPKSDAERQVIRQAQKAAHEPTRKPRSRVEEGRYSQTRGEYTGKAKERAEHAAQLRSTGNSWAQVGIALGVSAEAARCAAKWGRSSAPRPCIAPAG